MLRTLLLTLALLAALSMRADALLFSTAGPPPPIGHILGHTSGYIIGHAGGQLRCHSC